MQRLLYTLGYLFITTFLFSQQTIQLQNPSFEDMPRMGKAPVGWFNCGFPGESEPDVQPSQFGSPFFGVIQSASDGHTYIGMVVRDNDTWEMVGQKLEATMQEGNNYHCTIDLCRSVLYESMSRKLEKVVNYTTPVKLRIWGGDGYCSKKQLLAETPMIINTEWLKYNFVFAPTEDFDYLLFECFYKIPILFPYNGNLLMDNISHIIEVPKETADSLVNLKSQEIEKTLAESAKYGTISYQPNPSKNMDNAGFQNYAPVTVPVDSAGNIIRNWATAGVSTDTIRTFLKKMEIDLENETFTNDTEIHLKQLLKDLKTNGEYSKVVFGVLGDKKRRKKLSQPIYHFMEENNLTTDQLKIVKVPVGDLDDNWVGKNKYYRVRLE